MGSKSPDVWSVDLRHQDSLGWVESLEAMGVPFVTAFGLAKAVELLYGRHVSACPQLKLKILQKRVICGLFAGFLPLMSMEALSCRIPLEKDPKVLGDLVVKGVSLLFSDVPELSERMNSALVAAESLSDEVKMMLSSLELFLSQQHQALRRYYPTSGRDSVSTEVLGTRVIQEDLGPSLLPKIYRGLDELAFAAKSSNNWLPDWDSLLMYPLNLKQAQAFFERLRTLLGVLDDDLHKSLKDLFRLRWNDLDSRMLQTLESKFLWHPFMAKV
jgi:hypothetical protein